MNYMKEVAALLGVQLNEEFKMVDSEYNKVFLNTYKITEDGLCNCDRRSECDLSNLLTGKYQIQKIPFKPKYGDIYWTLRRCNDEIIAVNSSWYNEVVDYLHYYHDLCFHTKEDAEQNKDKLLKIIKYYEEN